MICSIEVESPPGVSSRSTNAAACWRSAACSCDTTQSAETGLISAESVATRTTGWWFGEAAGAAVAVQSAANEAARALQQSSLPIT